VRRAAMFCAGATGRDDVAEAELSVLMSLSRHAWSQASDVGSAPPIQVLHSIDAYALLHASGLEFRYDYYASYAADRYMPMMVAAWDPEAAQERVLAFDFVDVGYQLDRESPFSGFPVQREVMADAFLQAQTQANESLAADVHALRAARLQTTPQAKVAAMRTAAGRGGILSGVAWLLVCQTQPHDGCGDGFVDAWLPYAEQKHVMPMVLLAHAYEHGVGVEADAAAARQLLDAADKLSRHGHASVEYAQLWRVMHDDPLPGALRQRLVDAESRGEPNARMVLIRSAIAANGGQETFELSAADIEYLAEPDINQTGAGFSILADYHAARDEEQQSSGWSKRAALAGSVDDQLDYALILLEDGRSQAEETEGLEIMALAAHGGNAYAQRYLSYESSRDGRWSDAEGWLLDAAQGGDVDAILEVASLYEWEYPGVTGKLDRAVAIYTALAGEDGAAEARRRLAAMAIDGRGMEKDRAKAEAWLLVDAESGDHESETMLASMYLRTDPVDETEGLRWMERALEAEHPTAYVDYGGWLYYVKGTPESRLRAVEIWGQAHAREIPLGSNNLAWARCTAPEPALFNPAKGMEVVAGMGSPEHLGAAELDTLAACHAASGEFERARQLQQAAIDLVAKFQRDMDAPDDGSGDQEDSLEGYQSRLALYESGRHYVEPSSPE